MICDPNPGRQGMATHCPEHTDLARSALDRSGKWWPRAESCDEHADELIDVRRI
jgi:hypothetical protein